MRWADARALQGSTALALTAALALAVGAAARAQRGAQASAADGGETPAVFRRFASQVVKLQVIEVRSGAKQVTGSGFFVTADGRVLTNYHVVANLVHEPERYRAELLDSTGVRPVRVVAVDVVHDLAVLATDLAPRGWFALAPVGVEQGRRLYALGHPGDLGLSIVEGTYNGRLPHTLYPRIHFTGSINPGMSGGPTITIDGRVVGINVATAGNQQSFLVPVDDAAALLAAAGAHEARPAESLLADVGRQLLAYQDEYLRTLFADSVRTVPLGGWRLPTRPSEVFNCWGDADREEDRPYEIVHHYCSTDDDVFISADQSSGVIEFEHDLVTAEGLGRIRFHALFGREFASVARDWDLHEDGDEHVTGYRCRAGNLRGERLVARAVLCVQRYRKLPGLYDVVFRLATLGRPRAGVLSTLTLSGVSIANAQQVIRRYVGGIAWTE